LILAEVMTKKQSGLFLGHCAIEGRTKAKATTGRKRMHLLSDLMENKSYSTWKKKWKAQDRVGWRVKMS